MANQTRSYIVGLAGGSASGKSTFSGALKHILECSSPALSVEIISTDRYFLPAGKIPTYLSPSTGIETPHYNRPDSIDAERMLADLEVRAAAEDHPDVIVLEGLMVLFRNDIRAKLDLKLFVELEGEVRALRRLVRNLGHTYDPIVKHDAQSIADYYLESAWAGHQQYVEPSRRHADLILRGDGDFERAAWLVAAAIRADIHQVHDRSKEI